jgi:hypothetical protein
MQNLNGTKQNVKRGPNIHKSSHILESNGRKTIQKITETHAQYTIYNYVF